MGPTSTSWYIVYVLKDGDHANAHDTARDEVYRLKDVADPKVAKPRLPNQTVALARPIFLVPEQWEHKIVALVAPITSQSKELQFKSFPLAVFHADSATQI